MQYFTIFQDKLHSVNIQDHQSWAFSKTIQKMSKITYTASRFSLLSSAKFAMQAVVECLIELYFKHNKEFVYFLFKGTCSVLTTPASNVCEQLKTNSTAIKIPKKTTKHQQKKYNSLKHLQRQQFSFAKTSLEVSLKILSL